MRFKNTVAGMSKWLKVALGGERLESLNRRQYRIDVSIEVDASTCGKGGYCPP